MPPSPELPPENLEIFKLLFEIETSLRELIVEELSSAFGSKWYKQRLPGDVLQKYRQGLSAERLTKWSRLTPHHPIYYTDFAHLKVVIQNRSNWDDVFDRIFVKKDILEGLMAQLEFLRNKVAHNRRANTVDVVVARTCYEQLANMIGPSRMRELSSRCTHARSVPDMLVELGSECARANTLMCACEPLAELPLIESCICSWWFEESYIGHPIDKIDTFITKVQEYRTLARGRGTGHLIERWTKVNEIPTLYVAAASQLSAIQSNW